MQQPALRPRRLVMRLLAILAVAAALAPAIPAGAQYYSEFDGAPYEQLPGAQETTQRLYQNTTTAQLNIYATITRFDTDANAAAGLDALNAYYLDAFAAAASPLAFEPVDAAPTGALAYHATLALPGQDPYGEAAFVQGQQGPLVLEVLVLNYDSDPMPVDDANTIAAKMYDAMTVPAAGAATPAAGAVTDRFPAMGDALPDRYGITYAEDTALYAPEPATPPASSASDTPYGDATHLVSVVGRTYAVVDDSGETAVDAPRAYIEVAVFDEPANASVGFDGMGGSLTDQLGGMELETVTVDIDADATVAYTGQAEGDTGPLDIAVAVTVSDIYVVTVLVAAPAGSTEPLPIAEDLMQAVIGADAGSGEAQVDDTGGSTGGLWDKLPVAGDEALAGMTPVEDVALYP